MGYAEISAAFLQGQRLDDQWMFLIRFPKGYPDYVTDRMQGEFCRGVVKLTKGGFVSPSRQGFGT